MENFLHHLKPETAKLLHVPGISTLEVARDLLLQESIGLAWLTTAIPDFIPLHVIRACPL